MLFGSIWQTLGLFCMGALGTVNNPPLSIRNGIIALMPLFQAGFNIGWGAHMHVVVAEIPTLRLRDKTYAMGAACKYVSFPPLQSLAPMRNGMLTRHPKKNTASPFNFSPRSASRTSFTRSMPASDPRSASSLAAFAC